MYEFWYDYIKLKYQNNFFNIIADDVEKRYDTFNYEVDCPLPIKTS